MRPYGKTGPAHGMERGPFEAQVHERPNQFNTSEVILMNVRHGMWVLSALVLAPLVAAGPLLAQTAASGSSDSPLAASVGSATRVEVGPTVDGRLDDPVWMEAEP
jgi:hypothetical protein